MAWLLFTSLSPGGSWGWGSWRTWPGATLAARGLLFHTVPLYPVLEPRLLTTLLWKSENWKMYSKMHPRETSVVNAQNNSGPIVFLFEKWFWPTGHSKLILWPLLNRHHIQVHRTAQSWRCEATAELGGVRVLPSDRPPSSFTRLGGARGSFPYCNTEAVYQACDAG